MILFGIIGLGVVVVVVVVAGIWIAEVLRQLTSHQYLFNRVGLDSVNSAALHQTGLSGH